MRVRDVIRLLTDDGWFVVGRKGSHIQFKHPTKRACDHSRPPKPSPRPQNTEQHPKAG